MPRTRNDYKKMPTGLFEWLPNELLCAIILKIHTFCLEPDYLTYFMLATRVCKAWSSLKHSHELWHTLKITHISSDFLCFGLPINDHGLSRLLCTIDASVVRKFSCFSIEMNETSLSVHGVMDAISRFTKLDELRLNFRPGSTDSGEDELFLHVASQPWMYAAPRSMGWPSASPLAARAAEWLRWRWQRRSPKTRPANMRARDREQGHRRLVGRRR